MEKISAAIRSIICLPIVGYQKLISPLLGPRCCYYPSCSQYSIIAIKRFGVFYGLYLSIKRIISCHPGADGGIDHVPEKHIK
jgi:uncharacterized protein